MYPSMSPEKSELYIELEKMVLRFSCMANRLPPSKVLINDPPVAFNQADATNNPILTMVFSCAAGSFSQVATISETGGVTWETPVQAHYAGSYHVALTRMPRRLGLVSWNPAEQRLELVDSVDMYGRHWYEFQPEEYPWMIVGDRRPEGRVDSQYFTEGEYLIYSEAGTAEAVVLRRLSSGWTDESPGLVVAGLPRLRSITVQPLIGGKGLFYIDQQQQRIRLLKQDLGRNWLLQEIQTLVWADAGGVIEELDVYTNSNLSYNNYLVYTVDGSLYLRFSGYPDLHEWEEPVLLDDCGSCRKLEILLVGTDSEFNSQLLATYVSDGEEDTELLHFIDLRAVN